MEPQQEKLQWSMYVGVYHTRQFGHVMRMEHGSVGRRTQDVFLGRWKGAGIPEPEMRTASGILIACFEEHLVTRYGVQGETPQTWMREVGPF